MKEYIPRPLYTLRIEPFIDKSLIKVIIGQRRIGKSYVLLQLTDVIRRLNPNANIIYIDKELLEFSRLKNDTELYHYVKQKIAEKENNY